MSTGTLYIVATPIGNLNDITLRAIEVLKQVEVIAAEDTRHSKKLLDHYGIDTGMLSLHDHNEADRVNMLVSKLRGGGNIALISDAGTPLISDPGYRLVSEVRNLGLPVLSVPGACAAVSALSVSGLATDRFLFQGFLPAKKQARQTALSRLLNQSTTMIFYESPKRIVDCMRDIAEIMGGDRRVAVAKELTKKFETVYVAESSMVLEWLLAEDNHRRGEFVVLVEGRKEDSEPLLDAKVLKCLAQARAGMSLKQASNLISDLTGISKKQLYSAGLQQDLS